jgi:hypothetical protein
MLSYCRQLCRVQTNGRRKETSGLPSTCPGCFVHAFHDPSPGQLLSLIRTKCVKDSIAGIYARAHSLAVVETAAETLH